MLFYVGFTKRIGSNIKTDADVDEGSTVTDFLKTERERGKRQMVYLRNHDTVCMHTAGLEGSQDKSHRIWK